MFCIVVSRQMSRRLGICRYCLYAGKRANDVETERLHKPVLVQEVVDILQPKCGQLVVDMTFGGGGHTRAMLQAAENLHVIALDRDPLANRLAKRMSISHRVTPLLGKFSDLPNLLETIGVQAGSVDAMLIDSGASSMQYDEADRGFSLSRNGPLDMRMDNEGPSAADVVNSLDEKDLYHIIKTYGEERNARQIAHAIVQVRYQSGAIQTTEQLANIISTTFTGNYKRDKLMRKSHVATKTFQALRIFVNNELNELNAGLEIAHSFLRPGGRCVALSFHSLEDRIVKRHFHEIDLDLKKNASIIDMYRIRNASVTYKSEQITNLLNKKWKPIKKKVLLPDEDSVRQNPRARSAKLRAAEKLS